MANKRKTGETTGDAAEAAQVAGVTLGELALTLPVGDDEHVGYQSQLIEGGDVPLEVRGVHLNVHLGSKAAMIFARIRNGLRATGAKLDDGRPVWSNADALRYVFEALAEASPKP